MSAYRYRAARADGEPVSGVVEAVSGASAALGLAARGLYPIEVAETSAGAERKQRHSPAELAAVFSGLAALLKAGLPVDRAIACAESVAGPRLAPALAEVRRRVREGASLSAALAVERVAPDLALGLLRAGEAHGKLSEAARHVAAELEREAELKAQLRGALAYPVFLLVVGAFSVVLIVGVVVPRFAGVLGDLGQTLPPSTRLLLALSEAISGHGWWLLAGLGIGALAAPRVLAVPGARAVLHERLLAAPVLGAVRWGLAASRACRALASLLSSGLPLLPALELARGAAGDLAVAARLARVRADVSEGGAFGEALRRHQALPPQARQIASFGEASGRLAELLEHASRLEEAQARRKVRTLVTLVEPLLVVGFGGAVAFVAAALLQAVYSLRPGGF
jgi:type II secretory pathway component PulF